MMAFVFGLTAASSRSVFTLCVAMSTSIKTGIAPACTIGFTVVGKPAATVITSSPGTMARVPSFGDVKV